MKRALRFGVVLISGGLAGGCCLFGIGCKDSLSARTAADAIKRCAQSDLLPAAAIRYTGPTGAGPGSFWVQLSGQPPIFQIGALPEDIFGTPVPADIFAPAPAVANCGFDSSSAIDLKANVGADVSALPLSASAQTELKNAQVLKVTAKGFQWEPVKYLVYNQRLAASPSAHALMQPGVWAAVGMLRVRGYEATLDVSHVQGVDLAGKYSGPLAGAVTGNLSAGVSASYDGHGTLTLSVPGDAYVAGVFRPVNAQTGQVESAHPEPAAAANTAMVAVSVQGDRK